jgi:hypothetical protein
MTKNPTLIVLFLCSFSFNFAQTLGIGIKGGVNYNSIGDFYSKGGSIGSGVPDINYEADNEIGTQFGIFFSVNFEKFFIRPEINYVSLKNSYPFPTKPAKWTAQQMDVPLLFGYKIYKPVYIFAGPVFSFISDMNMEGWEDTSFADPFTYKNSSTSISVGILLDFGIVGVDFRYQYGLTTIASQRLDIIRGYNGYGVNLGDLTEYNPSQLMLGIQIKPFTLGGDKREKGSGSGWRNHKNL